MNNLFGQSRWQRQEQKHQRGYTPRGAKRQEYINAFKAPAEAAAPLPRGSADSGIQVRGDGNASLTGGTGIYIPASTQFVGYRPPTKFLNYYPITSYSMSASVTSNSITLNYPLNSPTAGIYSNFSGYTTGATATADGSGIWCNIDGGTAYGQPNRNGDIYMGSVAWSTPLSAKEVKRAQIREQLSPAIINHRGERRRSEWGGPDFSKATPAEMNALRLLRSLLPTEEWRRYLCHGFVVVRGKSGLVYRIHRGQSHVVVLRGRHKVAELCIATSRHIGVPPTDDVITRKVMIECDELSVWHGANIHQSQWNYQFKPQEADLKLLREPASERAAANVYIA